MFPLPCQALVAILSRFCTGYLIVPLAVQDSDGTDHSRDSARNRDEVRIAVRAHLLLLSDASGHREGQLENTRIPNGIEAFHDSALAGQAAPGAGERPPSRWAGRHVASVPAPQDGRGGPRESWHCGCKTIQKHKENKGFYYDPGS